MRLPVLCHCFLIGFSSITLFFFKFSKWDTGVGGGGGIECMCVCVYVCAHFVCHLSLPEGFTGSSAGKESTCNVGDPGSIPGSGRSAGEGKGYPLQCSDLENSMDCIVHGVTKSQTCPSDFHFHFISLPDLG